MEKEKQIAEESETSISKIEATMGARIEAMRETMKFRCLYDNLCTEIDNGNIPCNKEALDRILDIASEKIAWEETCSLNSFLYETWYSSDEIWVAFRTDPLTKYLSQLLYPQMKYILTNLRPEEKETPYLITENTLVRFCRLSNIRKTLNARCQYGHLCNQIEEKKFPGTVQMLEHILDILAERISDYETVTIQRNPFPKDPFIYCLMQVQYPQLSYVFSKLTPEDINDPNFDEKVLQQLYHTIGRVW